MQCSVKTDQFHQSFYYCNTQSMEVAKSSSHVYDFFLPQ